MCPGSLMNLWGQRQDSLVIIGAYRVISISYISGDCSTSVALEVQHQTLLRIHVIRNGTKKPLTGIGPVTRKYIDVFTGQAKRAMVTAARCCCWNMLAAMFARKRLIFMSESARHGWLAPASRSSRQVT